MMVEHMEERGRKTVMCRSRRGGGRDGVEGACRSEDARDEVRCAEVVGRDFGVDVEAGCDVDDGGVCSEDGCTDDGRERRESVLTGAE